MPLLRFACFRLPLMDSRTLRPALWWLLLVADLASDEINALPLFPLTDGAALKLPGFEPLPCTSNMLRGRYRASGLQIPSRDRKMSARSRAFALLHCALRGRCAMQIGD